MKRQRRRTYLNRENVMMLLTSVMVLLGLTLAGLCIRSRDRADRTDGYTAEYSFSVPEQRVTDKTEEIGNAVTENREQSGEQLTVDSEVTDDIYQMLAQRLEEARAATERDLEAAGNATAEGLEAAENAVTEGLTAAERELREGMNMADASNMTGLDEIDRAVTEGLTEAERVAREGLAEAERMAREGLAEAERGREGTGEVGTGQADQTENTEGRSELLTSAEGDETLNPDLHTPDGFTTSIVEGDHLVWPISGRILIPWAVDKTVYFATLDQYRYSKAVVAEATAGDVVTVPAAGVVKEVWVSPESGTTVRVNIGRGYEMLLGQLTNLQVREGSILNKGDEVGVIAEPAGYYIAEGANLFIKLLYNGEAVDPFEAIR